jgi:hypothetical protein
LLITLENAQAQKIRRLHGVYPDPIERAQATSALVDYFAACWLRIGLKEAGGGLAPFVFNPIQMDHLAGLRRQYRRRPGIDHFRGIRDLILKPRRLGFSTYIAALYFLDGIHNPGTNTRVMAHTDDVVTELFDIYKIFYETLPADVQERVHATRMSTSEMELVFRDENGNLDMVSRPPSIFQVATAGGKDKRGITPHNLHLSEAAFYDNWSQVNRSIVQAVSEGGNVILESTARGFNHYKDLVDAALDGRSQYRLVFYPWFAFPEYRQTIDHEQARMILQTLDAEEKELTSRCVTPAQLAWRRWKLTGMDLLDFHQEFPSSVLEAFISTGRPAFNQQVVVGNWEKSKRAREEKRWTDRDEFTTIFFPPEPNAIYVMSCDPAEGIDRGEGDSLNEVGGEDYSSASIRDAATLRVMAKIHGRMEPPEFASRCMHLGLEYNEALLVVERNNHGHLVLYVCEQAGYPNIYRHQEYDASGQIFHKLGFPMTPVTRPLVVDTLREVVKRDACPDPDPNFWKECSFFTFNAAGKAEAQEGRHDDRVMDSAIGVYVCTIGAKAWGGDGYLRGADSAGLPIPLPAPVAMPAPATASAAFTPVVPLPQAQPTEPPPAPALMPAIGFVHPFLERLSQVKDEYRAPEVPTCGNCDACPQMPQGSVLVCTDHGFRIDPTMPSCMTWRPRETDMMERQPVRIDIYGGGQ